MFGLANAVRCRLALAALITFTLSCGTTDRAVTVDWNDVRQTIDGFGAASNETSFVEPLPDSLVDFFFTTNGLGYSLLRIRDYPSVSDCEHDSAPGVCVPTSGATLLKTDLAIARKAVERGVTVWSSQWSPPGSMKTNGDFMKGGAMIGSDQNYSALARVLGNFVTFMAAQGVRLHAISPQNEPDMSTWYPSATWTPKQIHDFVPYLHDALTSGGVGETQILIAEQSHWEPRWRWWWRDSFRYATDAMSDPSVASRVGILAAHNYDQRNPTRPPRIRQLTTQHVWQTEASSMDPFDGGLANALIWAERIHAFVSAARVHAFHFWYLTAGPNNVDNQMLIDKSGRVALRAYALAHWSKFVRPGWHAVTVHSAGPLLVTAFQNQARTQSAMVVVNTTATAVRDQRFVVGSAMAAVTPWMTSSGGSLARQAPLPVVDGAVTYTIPERSIVSLSGR